MNFWLFFNYFPLNLILQSALKNEKTLPFVVIARPDGTLVSSIASYQNAESYNKFIMSAKSKSKK